MADVQTLTRRDVAHLAREFGQATGLDGYGARGRVSENLVLQFVLATPAAQVRQIAADLGVTISPKGKISEDEALAVAAFVARNAPKAEVTESE
jgi:hypothetical protein